MAEETIKRIGSFSSDGIKQAIARVLDDDEKDTFWSLSTRVLHVLGEPTKSVAKRNVKKSVNLTSREVFDRSILPQIRQKLSNYEQNLLSNCTSQWKINFDFPTDFSNCTLAELLAIHTEILKQETNVENMNLMVKFHRGMLYLAAYKGAMQEHNITAWFQTKLGVNYKTALRYMTYALMIRRYPRLIICGLKFDQLIKHSENIDDFLESETEGMKERLGIQLDITAQGKKMTIESGEVYIPRLTFQSDPDIEYFNEIADVTPDEHFHAWLTEQNNSGELTTLLFPPDATSTMETQLNRQVEQLEASTTELNIASTSTIGLTTYSDPPGLPSYSGDLTSYSGGLASYSGIGYGRGCIQPRALPWNPEKK